MKKSTIDKLWELRIATVVANNAREEMLSRESVEGKISGYTDKGILMSPVVMKQTVEVLKGERVVDNHLINFGRSNPKGSGQKTATQMLIESKKISNSSELAVANKKFEGTLKELELFMVKNGIEHSFKCKIIDCSYGEIDKLFKTLDDNFEQGEIESIDDYNKQKKMLKDIKTKKLYDVCDLKPYSCLSCVCYYGNKKEYEKFKQLRKKEDEKNKDI